MKLRTAMSRRTPKSLRTRLRALCAALALGMTVSLAACAPADPEVFTDGVPVTSAQAQVLAATRFRNFDAGTRSVSFTVTDAAVEQTLTGWFDYASGVGYGLLESDGEPELTLWNADVRGIHPATGDEAPLPVPDVDTLATSWTGGALDGSSSRLDAVLSIVAAMGDDRPENPLLLQQQGALWLGERTLDGRTLQVFAGPPSEQALPAGQTAQLEDATTRFWVDDVGLLYRLDVRLGDGGAWTSIAFGDGGGVALGDPFDQESGP